MNKVTKEKILSLVKQESDKMNKPKSFREASLAIELVSQRHSPLKCDGFPSRIGHLKIILH